LKHRKTTLITTETSEVWVIREVARGTRAWCKPCGAQVEMVPAELAGRAIGANARKVFRLIEAGRVHSTDKPDGSSWVCLNTLAQIEESGNEENV